MHTNLSVHGIKSIRCNRATHLDSQGRAQFDVINIVITDNEGTDLTVKVFTKGNLVIADDGPITYHDMNGNVVKDHDQQAA